MVLYFYWSVSLWNHLHPPFRSFIQSAPPSLSLSLAAWQSYLFPGTEMH